MTITTLLLLVGRTWLPHCFLNHKWRPQANQQHIIDRYYCYTLHLFSWRRMMIRRQDLKSFINGETLIISFVGTSQEESGALHAAVKASSTRPVLPRVQFDLDGWKTSNEEQLKLIVATLRMCVIKDLTILLTQPFYTTDEKTLYLCLFQEFVRFPTKRLNMSEQFFDCLNENETECVHAALRSSEHFRDIELVMVALENRRHGFSRLVDLFCQSKKRGSLRLYILTGGAKILNQLLCSSSLQHIHFNAPLNDLEGTSSNDLKKALISNASLQELSLGSTNPEIVRAIVSALEENNALTSLCLDPLPVADLVASLPRIETLQVIYGDWPSDRSASGDLLEALHENTSLLEWKAVANSRSAVPEEARRILERNNTLRKARQVLSLPSNNAVSVTLAPFSTDMEVCGGALYTLVREFVPPVMEKGAVSH